MKANEQMAPQMVKALEWPLPIRERKEYTVSYSAPTECGDVDTAKSLNRAFRSHATANEFVHFCQGLGLATRMEAVDV